MKKCIYCQVEKPESEYNREAVIPESFGAFGSKTPYLDCVCSECNSFFGKQLDQFFARDTIEGITRYNNQLMSKDARPQVALTIALPHIPEVGEFAGAIVWINGQTGEVMPPLAQVIFLRLSDQKYISVLKSELKTLDHVARGLSDKNFRILAPSKEEHDELVEIIKTIFPNYKFTGWIGIPSSLMNKRAKILVNIQGIIGHRVKRALAKYLFNFATKYIGTDEVSKTVWNNARRYIRYNDKPLRARATNSPFWGEESDQVRFLSEGYNLRIQNWKNNLIGEI